MNSKRLSKAILLAIEVRPEKGNRLLKRHATLLSLCISAVFAGAMSTSASAATPIPTADYRFNDNLRSSVHAADVPRLERVGKTVAFEFGSGQIHGQSDRYLMWASGAGLKLPTAKKVLGSGDDYTIAMLVKLNDISGFRKLVDLNNRTLDQGWYEHDGYLHPYAVNNFEAPNEPPIQEDRWHLIVATRADGNVKGYVDGRRYFTLPDSEAQEVLGSDEILHFFIDDNQFTADEQTGGRVARLRIWKNPLTNRQANNLKA
jgi:Concanavalin A-like lectin/glucanases superfamily